MLKPGWLCSLLTGMVLWVCSSGTGLCNADSGVEKCMQEALRTAPADTTVGELREQCQGEAESAGTRSNERPNEAGAAHRHGAIQRRLAADQENLLDPFSLMAHKPNYFLFASHTSGGINPEPFRAQFDDPKIDADDLEARFQISIKTPLGINLFEKPVDVYVAYTNRSFWQVYNDDASAPFRETNHEPEIWVQYRPNRELLGFRNNVNILGLVHQSNGRGGALSRSWNRVYANFVFEKSDVFNAGDTVGISISPWLRLPEDDTEDDNPDITDFMGHGRIGLAYKWRNNVFSLMLRNNFESGFNKGAVDLSWSFPVWKYPYLRGYVKWFNGYGESLIDYNVHNNSIGIGILLTDWL